ncbi:MAG: transposase [Planctomycetes bacterium]|nr:transposase [Planctomycetota bacterium]
MSVAKRPTGGEVRLETARREQLELVPTNIDELIAADHPARAIWILVKTLDLSKFVAECKSRGENAGRPAIDPAILVTLWIFAASQGVGSARELARLTREHSAYRWIRGQVDVSYHTLSDFRVGHGVALDGLLAEVLAVLMHQDLLTLERTAQDGVKVRASAGSSSFHRQPSLEKCRKKAEEQLDRLKKELESAPQDAARKAARKEVAARDLLARVNRAIAEIPKVAELKKRRNPADARASTTDPEARVMRMADGGFRPAYNVQLTTDTKSRVVAGVRVTNKPADWGLMKSSLDDLKRRTGRTPRQHLVDGGYSAMKDVEELAAHGIAVFAPLQTPRTPGRDRYQPREGQSKAVSAWRRRMGSSRGREIYKLRASTAETVNADLRCFRGLDRFLVRTLPKVTCVVLWSVIAYDLMRFFKLTH